MNPILRIFLVLCFFQSLTLFSDDWVQEYLAEINKVRADIVREISNAQDIDTVKTQIERIFEKEKALETQFSDHLTEDDRRAIQIVPDKNREVSEKWLKWKRSFLRMQRKDFFDLPKLKGFVTMKTNLDTTGFHQKYSRNYLQVMENYNQDIKERLGSLYETSSFAKAFMDYRVQEQPNEMKFFKPLMILHQNYAVGFYRLFKLLEDNPDSWKVVGKKAAFTEKTTSDKYFEVVGYLREVEKKINELSGFGGA